MGRGHPHVHDGDVRSTPPHDVEELVGVGALTGYLEVALGEDPGQAFAEQRRVFCDHDAHGISPLTRVPPPAGLSIRRRPP
jgi:hypothetical protein